MTPPATGARARSEWAAPRPLDAQVLQRIQEAFPYHPAVVRMLVSRGLTTAEEVDLFTRPRLSRLGDPFQLKGMEPAVARILQAIDGNEKVLVYGDYDADGITATALLILFLRSTGVPHTYYLPNRLTEGYGLNETCIRQCQREQIRLLVTLDCGIKSFRECALARECGIDVIITDHHTAEETVPECCAVVNPKQPGCPSGMEELSGVGVVFKLIHALLIQGRKTNRPWATRFDLKQYLDLVLIGTLADKVPLRSENRTLVRHGLDVLRRTDKVGLRLLAEDMQPPGGPPISLQDILFRLIPKINASGRVDSPEPAVELLLTDDQNRGQELVYLLNEFNKQRKAIEDTITRDIEQQLTKARAQDAVIVLASDRWHIGVLGIVASKLCQKHHRPVILFQPKGDMAKASARSPDGGDDILELILRCQDLVVECGGHRNAAGLSVRTGQIDAFRDRIVEEARKLQARPPAPRLYIDAEMEFKDITPELLRDLDLLEPFGVDNPPPVFRACGVTIKTTPKVFQNGHFRVRLLQGRNEFDGQGFGLGHRVGELTAGSRIDVLFQPSADTFAGRRAIALRLADFRPSA